MLECSFGDDAVCDVVTPFPAMKETLVWEGV